ncbi:MAG: SpvB/TcaC N-terminal domain-containing protein, partial [Bacteroidota bacterium]
MFNRREEENNAPGTNRLPAGNATTNAPGNGRQGNDPQQGAEEAAQGEGNAQQGPPGQPQGIQMPEVPTIELPRGGGAIQGMGEKFQANPVTGTGSFSVPIAMSPGRGGFTPALGLQYDSGNGNGVYGLGWSSGLPSISRKTQRNLPQYQDEVDSDTFLLSGAEDLVPTLKEVSGDWIPDVLDDPSGDYTIKRYRPRIEGLWARIEKWVRKSDGDCYWKSITRDNITTLYGQTPASRITDPDDARKVFQWLIDETYDAMGNVMLYEYKQENADGIEADHLHERNRLQFGKAFNFQYLKKVKYSNRYMRNSTPYNPNANWLFQLVFDYGEHDTANPTPDDNGTWNVRQDPYSTYRAGFEVRTWRLCERILMFHQFDELGPDPVLVKSTNFTYDHNPTVTRLLSVRHWSYEPGQPPASLPPLAFTYTEAERDKTLRQFDVDDLENLPAGLDGQRYTWTDLEGEGISGILVEEQGGWYYKRNFGDEGYYYDYPVNNPPDPDIRFGALETVATKPSLGTTGQLQDMDGDGNLELVVRTPALSGYFELQQDGAWQTFKAFEQSPNVNWNDPNLRLIDLNGDGIADVLITEDQCLRWFPSLDEKRGHAEARQTARATEEEHGPALVFADREQSVYLADMSGD